MYYINTGLIGLRNNPIKLSEINLADITHDYIKFGQKINAELKKVKRDREDLFLKYKLGGEKWYIQQLFPLANNKMIVFFNRENEQDTTLHVSLEVPFYPENFELKIENICKFKL